MSQALETWRKKLNYLQKQEAIVADPGQLFSLAEQIEQAKAKIAELEKATERQRPIVQGPFHADISRIIKYAPAELIGREAEIKLLSDAWDKTMRGEPQRPHVLTFVALGGEGKTSLVAKWAAEMAHRDWPGCEAVFAWSFYSQGTREQTAASSDIFLREALTVFGDSVMAGSVQGAFDKGRRLAQLVGSRGALLILDGLEPLQYAPTSPTPGELKDQGIAALLKALAATNHGLCVVTTRYAIPDLRAYWQTTAPVHELLRLSTAAGVKLLRTLGVKTGSQADFEKLVEDVDGHALTLQILGGFLARAFQGDIRRRDRIDFEKADARIQGGHAFRAMEAYVKWLENDSDEARREVALLELLGLFDRPATADCVHALRQAPAIPGLTEPLVGLAEEDWEFSLTSLRNAKLLTVNRQEGSRQLVALDAHPLLREYFASRIREQQPKAWRAAHRRLYEHLCQTTTDQKPEPTLEDLQPLYQAVAHGCQAGLHEDAFDKIFFGRIHRGTKYYAYQKLGAFGSNLSALAGFFDRLWDQPSKNLPTRLRSSVLAGAGFDLRATGRLQEALEPIRAAIEEWIQKEDWLNAAVPAGNLSELELRLGEVARALADAEQSVAYADRSGDAFQRSNQRGKHADALHQAGRLAEAEARFREAEQMQVESEPIYALLYSVNGFRYCDLLLRKAERAAWRLTLASSFSEDLSFLLASCRAVNIRATTMLKWEQEETGALLPLALHYLTLGRAALYSAILEGRVNTSLPAADFPSAIRPGKADGAHLAIVRPALDTAMDGLRRAGHTDHLPFGLLTRAWLQSLTSARAGPENAQSDLDDAWEIAERGPMPLFLTDIHLHRARLFFREQLYPWESPKADLAEARRLIEKHGYWRRKLELEDAEAELVR